MISTLPRIFRTLTTSPAVRQSTIVTIGTIASGVTMAVAFIFVSRALGPEQFGVFSVSLALMGVLMRVPDLGLSQVMLKMLGNWHNQPAKVNSLLSMVLYWKGWLSAGLIVFGTAAIPIFAYILDFPYPNLLFLTVLGSALFALYEYVYIGLSARHQFTAVSLLGMAQSVIKAGGFGALILLGVHTVVPLATLYFIAPPLVGGLLLWLYRSTLFARPQAGTPALHQEIKSFAVHAAIGTVFMTLISNLDLLMVQGALSPFETGIYSGAGKVAAFVAFLSGAVGGVLNNRVSRYRDFSTLTLYLQKSMLLVLASVLGFLCFVPFAYWAILWTIGPEYVTGVPALLILVLNAFMSLAIVPYIAFFYAVDRPSYFSVGGAIQVFIILFGNLFFLESYGIMAAAWSRVIATAVFAVYTSWSIWQEMRVMRGVKSR